MTEGPYARVVDFAGGVLNDDLALLAVRLDPLFARDGARVAWAGGAATSDAAGLVPALQGPAEVPRSREAPR